MKEKLKTMGTIKITTKDRIFNAGYGIGASIVILGVLFKLMYWEGADIMLTVGLIAEAIIFFMSAFERPLKTYEWDKVIDFESGKIDLKLDSATLYQPTNFAAPTNTATAPMYPSNITPIQVEGLKEEDAKLLSQSIQNLARTASQLNDIAAISLETEKYTNSIRHIAESTSQYAFNQQSLIDATKRLNEVYDRINLDSEKIEVNTREYRSRVERMNTHLAGMNSIYEIQLKDIHAQSVHFHNQTEISKKMSEEMQIVTNEISKMRNSSDSFNLATDKLRINANELADNIAKLNAIYGNMLNSMS